MTPSVGAGALRLRLATAEAGCSVWRAVGNTARWQESHFVAASLRLRLAHRLPQSALQAEPREA